MQKSSMFLILETLDQVFFKSIYCIYLLLLFASNADVGSRFSELEQKCLVCIEPLHIPANGVSRQILRDDAGLRGMKRQGGRRGRVQCALPPWQQSAAALRLCASCSRRRLRASAPSSRTRAGSSVSWRWRQTPCLIAVTSWDYRRCNGAR